MTLRKDVVRLTKDTPRPLRIGRATAKRLRRPSPQPLHQPDFIAEVADAVAEPEPQHPDLDAVLAQMRRLKEQAALFGELEAEAVTLYKRYGLDSYRGCTLVQGSTTTLDHAALLSVLSPEQRRLILVPAIDAAKLDGAVKTGQIPAMTLARHITTKPSKPYFTNVSKFEEGDIDGTRRLLHRDRRLAR